MAILNYLTEIEQIYKSGIATEHGFRANLQNLVRALVTGILVINEPKRQECGSPDFVLIKNNIPVGYIEAKDIGDSDLEGVKKSGNKEQFDRYKSSLNNLIFTDYLRFYLYRDGEFITKISIAEIVGKSIKPLTENFTIFKALITDFCSYVGQTIKDSKKLAEIMAGKARLLSYVISNALTSDEDKKENSTLKDQIAAFKQILIHDITPKEFADIYAQTIAYGMFAARLHDPTLQTFSRQEAYELIPDSNPFLKKLFGYIAGLELDDRIVWIVDDLVNIFLACNVEEMLYNYKKNKGDEDPIIHFYEDFLKEYDPKLRKSRGVWYTPTPVVNFITRAVDDILKEDFNLKQGLADTSKTIIKIEEDNGKKIEQEVHRVQILDPATGTGTFLAEVIKQIYKKFEGQQGIWSSYVETHLLPRLNGFELLMASYAMAHLKLDLLLREFGYLPTSNQRFRVFLTNSLEEQHPITETLFARWLSNEANEANRIKRDTPVMCVIGNPPYSVSSSNKGKWIQNLIADYKKDLNERKINLDDDYIKFIRYGQHFIDKNGSGILAYISNNSFIDGITHRQMRKNLLESFDKIYILDLHGNTMKNETVPDGSADENVFDIRQGVSINIFVKTGKKNELGKVFHFDLYGKRDFKYDFLSQKKIKDVLWSEIEIRKPEFFFTPIVSSESIDITKHFKIEEVFNKYNSGIQTGRDEIVISENKSLLLNQIKDIVESTDLNKVRQKYNLKDSSGWSLENFRKTKISESYIKSIQYKPFDTKFIYFEPNALKRDRLSEAKHLIKGQNISLICMRQYAYNVPEFCYIFCSKNIIPDRFFISNKGTPYFFPLYLYSDESDQQTIGEMTKRTPNLNLEIVDKIAEKLGLRFTNEKETTENTFAPIDLLDYIYAVLHSPKYREKYKEFLKIDFPRVPYPKDKNTFWQLVKLGGEIRQIHLLESPVVEKFITKYTISGDNTVSEVKYINGKVYINDLQYFENVPQIAWEFYIGGYQPAQKWLKDRRGRNLNFEDILHYQKIIVALSETYRLMKEIDKVKIL